MILRTGERRSVRTEASRKEHTATKTLGLIGAGHIGSQISRLGVTHGYDVVISNSRGRESLSALVSELGAAAFAPDPAVPLTEYNRPGPATLRSGTPPGIYEAGFRRRG